MEEEKDHHQLPLVRKEVAVNKLTNELVTNSETNRENSNVYDLPT